MQYMQCTNIYKKYVMHIYIYIHTYIHTLIYIYTYNLLKTNRSQLWKRNISTYPHLPFFASHKNGQQPGEWIKVNTRIRTPLRVCYSNELLQKIVKSSHSDGEIGTNMTPKKTMGKFFEESEDPGCLLFIIHVK